VWTIRAPGFSWNITGGIWRYLTWPSIASFEVVTLCGCKSAMSASMGRFGADPDIDP
jgi:hypothetical protein